MVRMVRLRILKALENVDDWRVDEPNKVTRPSDGLWVLWNHGQHANSIEIGNTDHGVAQIVIDADQELISAFQRLANFHPTSNRSRSIFNNLNINI